MEDLFTAQYLVSFLTLFALELVLGVDNVIFISILAGKLPQQEQAKARNLGLTIAVVSRLILLMSLSWVIGLKEPLFSLAGQEFSGRDLILLIGGLFLLGKATLEIHHKLEGESGDASKGVAPKLSAVLLQIFFLDVVFSLDSVITAVGMVDKLAIMVAAVLASTAIMIFFAGKISAFVDAHPTLKILALSFLLMIGLTLVVEALHGHVPKGYIYFAMGFSVFVEVLNIRLRKKAVPPVKLRERVAEDQ